MSDLATRAWGGERTGVAATRGVGIPADQVVPIGMEGEQTMNPTLAVLNEEQTLQRYALDAGFNQVEVLPIDNFFFRFYRLHA